MGLLTDSHLCTSLGKFVFLCCLLVAFHATPSNAYAELSDDALRAIESGSKKEWDIKTGSLLAPILIPRVPGTPGSLKAQQHFIDFFRENLPDWVIEWHNSTSKTPATGDKDVPFTNIIFRRDPPWARVGDVSRLTLASHFDTLYQPDGFIGAIDSAAPCAMLLQVARSVDKALAKKWKAMEAAGEGGDGLEEDVGVQIIMLDGEEAWVQWTEEDSLYGSRALAASWESQSHPASSIYSSPLTSISLFVLLDLLGAPDPRIPSWFPKTHEAYANMARAEERMRKLGALETRPKRAFLPEMEKVRRQFSPGYVEDDHIPFMVRGVDILHMIPSPFPPVWHTMDDDGDHLDMPTVRDWAKIVTAFVAEWMEIGEYMPVKSDEALRQELGYEDEKTEL